MSIIVEVKNIKKVYSSKAEVLEVLKGLNFKVRKGEHLCLLGRSGSGKTTTLNIIAGIDKPTSGSIKINEQEITTLNRDKLAELRLKTMGYIFQEFHLLNHLTALENIMVPLIINGVKGDEAQERAYELLNLVGIQEKANNFVEELSTGQKQRIAVARAIANKPKLLIADEPTGTLDSESSDAIMQLLTKISEEQDMTMIFTTHDPYVARNATRVLVLHEGLISELKVNPSKIDYGVLEEVYNL